MSTYLRESAGDLPQALLLYRWNSEVSAAVWEVLGHMEIVLRNAIHGALTTRHQRESRPGFWFDDKRYGLHDTAAREVVLARRRATQVPTGRRPSSPVPDGKIVAELSFGFWRYLLAKRYAPTLWPAIRHGFPHLPSRRRENLEQPVTRLHRLRNRIGHHEPVLHEDLPGRIGDVTAVLDFVDTELTGWVFDDRVRLDRLLANRPTRN
ncbi:hypothetical protein [Pseudonocardia dioxanivorans]|uniref:hypothetical protein n=1 Tax=Pseudonocardia dioxanivorans TaxID=240495 RepID=UPI001042AE51|nr:hypothetical protein [Pseudonocardia dioxanivorans]